MKKPQVLDIHGNEISSKVEKEVPENPISKEKVANVSKALALAISGLIMAKEGLNIFSENEVPVKKDITTLESAVNLINSRLDKINVLFEQGAILSTSEYSSNFAILVDYLSKSSAGDFFGKLDLVKGILNGNMICLPKGSFISILKVMNSSTDEVVVNYSKSMIDEKVADFLIKEEENKKN